MFDEIDKCATRLIDIVCLFKSNHLSSKELYDDKICGAVFSDVMCRERFKFLLNFLHFDDKNTRDKRIKKRMHWRVQKFGMKFISLCKNLYRTSSYVTINEQLLSFRGRCSFRLYIP